MTIYRRWPDMQTLLADLMTREWSTVRRSRPTGEPAAPATGWSTAVAGTVALLRGNELFRKIVDVDPELLLPYLLDRRGRTQDAILELARRRRRARARPTARCATATRCCWPARCCSPRTASRCRPRP